jgi:hypothetical protein
LLWFHSKDIENIYRYFATLRGEQLFCFLVKANKKPEDVKNADSWEYNTDKKWIKIIKKGKSFSIEIDCL